MKTGLLLFLLNDFQAKNIFMIHVYVDESCKDAHKFLVIGGIAIKAEALQDITSRLISVREDFNYWGEIKWSKCSRLKLDLYKRYVDVFYEAAEADITHFHCMTIDTSTINNRLHNDGCPEIGFNKLIYQLLMHKFGKRYGDLSRLYVYLDDRDTKQKPELMLPMLNSNLRKMGIDTRPFRLLTFQKSHTSELLQLNDVLLGSVGYRLNALYKAEDASQHKKELMHYIVKKTMQLENPQHAALFTTWSFRYNYIDAAMRGGVPKV